MANLKVLTSDPLQSYLFSQGSGYFLFFPEKLRANIRDIKHAFAEAGLPLRLAYSIKANPSGAVLQTCEAEGVSFECASEEEIMRVKQSTVSGSGIHLNTPWLGEQLAVHCVDQQISVYLDGWEQIDQMERLAQRLDKTLEVGVRLHALPERPSRFGMAMTEENLRLLLDRFTANKFLRLSSLHCHYSGPDRSADHFAARCVAMKKAYDVLKATGTVRSLNIGGGMVGPIPGNQAADWSFDLPTWPAYASVIRSELGAVLESNNLQLIIEPGSAVVANTFAFVAKVVALKEAQGQKLAIVNTSNTVLRPTGHAKKLSIEVIPAQGRPVASSDEAATEIVGNTCMENDRIATYPGTLQVGDKLVFNNMGAYTISFANDFIYGRPEIRIFGS